jgi:ATP-dependent exoDNAse (exonuclease V) beta subunit
LISEGVSPQHILAITFTNKAASEMRERILNEVHIKLPSVWHSYQKGEFSFRISTIHSFLAEILFRFSLESGIDPDFEIMGEVQSGEFFEQCVNEALGEMGVRDNGLLFRLFEQLDYRGLKRALRGLFEKRPLTEFWARMKAGKDSFEGSLASVYLASLSLYERKKVEEGKLDFADLEVKSYQILQEEDASDLLLFFNEHIQHLLMDEFQDTNEVQWQIVEKLTEDWLSGQGLREVTGASIYLVGDPKQSIYRFRGADVTVFQRVREMFDRKAAEREGRKHFSPCVVKKENYRSLKGIVKFVNSFFKDLMEGGNYLWEVKFESFEAVREGEGDVALIPVVKDKKKKVREHKVEEASLVAKKIAQIIEGGSYEFKDIALLFPIRTHFKVFEEALRKRGIPFQTEKGKGFFSSPEVNTFTSILKFLVKKDDVSLLTFLQSPVSPFDLSSVFPLCAERKGLLWDFVKNSPLKKASFLQKIEKWLELKDDLRPSFLLEFIYEETFAYLAFPSPGAQANLDKLLQIVTQMEKESGGSLSEVVRAVSLLELGEEGGAEIEEELDAVRIMTVHSAKGLQFPIVFVVDVDGLARTRPPALIYDEDESGGKITLGFQREKSEEIWKRSYQKDLEEKKRVFYVACTRAQDALYISGVFDLEGKKESYFWNKLVEGEEGEIFSPYGIRLERDLKEIKVEFNQKKEAEIAFSYRPRSEIKKKSSKSIEAKVGEIIHIILDEVSRGLLVSEKDLEKRVCNLSLLSGLGEREIKRVSHDVEVLKRKGLWSKIILKPGFTELTYFSLEDGISEGRFDKVFLNSGEVWVVDYKTDEVSEEEAREKVPFYLEQMKRYKKAASNLFKGKKLRFFLLFTYCGLLQEVLAEET